MTLLDSNIPMYLVGSSLTHKASAQHLVERCILQGERLVTDAEVLQEILHRYMAIRRLDAIQPAFDAILGIVDEVFPVERVDAESARDILMGSLRLSARDALHVAIMKRRGVSTIISFDVGFDGLPGLTRLG